MDDEIKSGDITALKIQKKNPNRVNVFLEDHFGFGVHKSLAAELRLGQHLTPVEVEVLLERDEEEKAYQRALRLISRRPHAERELREKLSRERIPSEICERVIDRLEAASLLDDAAFAEAWVEDRKQFRPRSARALRHELRQKGVDSQVIETALSGFDDEQAAREAGRKAVRRYRSLPEETAQKRMLAYLARRGFPYRMARAVVDDLLTEGSGTERESEGLP